MIHLSNSIFKSFLSCPARTMAMYKGRITGDPDFVPTFVQDGSKVMAAGSLVDAMATKGFKPDIDEDVAPEDFYGFLKSSYDDGMKSATLLCNKSTKTKKGGWNADAKTAIRSAERLMADPVAKDLIDRSEKQVRISFMLDEETRWEGDLDFICMEDRVLRITDLKAPGAIEKGGWIKSGGRNVKVNWQDSWSYWFQLSGYRYAFTNMLNNDIKNTLVNGVPLADTKYSECLTIDTGLLVTTREKIPWVGYIPIPDYSNVWKNIVKGRHVNEFSGEIEPSNLEYIKNAVKRKNPISVCDDITCPYCNPLRRVELSESFSDDGITPAIDDIYGYLEINNDNIYADEY